MATEMDENCIDIFILLLQSTFFSAMCVDASVYFFLVSRKDFEHGISAHSVVYDVDSDTICS